MAVSFGLAAFINVPNRLAVFFRMLAGRNSTKPGLLDSSFRDASYNKDEYALIPPGGQP